MHVLLTLPPHQRSHNFKKATPFWFWCGGLLFIFASFLWGWPTQPLFAVASTNEVIITGTVPGCGDGAIQTGESCDGSNLNNQTCSSQGFTGGTLSCNANCAFNTSQCASAPSGGGGWTPPSPTEPVGGFKIIINSNVGKTNSRVVNLVLRAGSDVTKMAISNTGDFKDAGQEEYTQTKTWNLCSKFSNLILFPDCPDGNYTVYVKYYTAWGRASEIVSDTIVLDTTPEVAEKIKEHQEPSDEKEYETPTPKPSKPTPGLKKEPPKLIPAPPIAIPITPPLERESKTDKPSINISSNGVVLDSTKTLKLIAGTSLNVAVKPAKPATAVKIIIIFKKPSQGGFSLVPLDSAQTSKQDQLINEYGWQMSEYFLVDTDGDGVFESEIDLPDTTGEYVIRITLFYEDGTVENIETKLLIDPKGYNYQDIDGKELRIPNAKVSIYAFNPEINKYELWPAQNFNQKNPQITDKTGEYAFLVPEGTYYLTVEVSNYKRFESKKFEVREGGNINENISLTPVSKFDWRWLFVFFIFITGLIIVVFIRRR